MAALFLLLPQVWIKKMKTLSLWTVPAAAFLLLICCNCFPDSSISSTSPGGFKAELSNRKLKDIVSSTINTAIIGDDSSNYNLDDYPGNDPSPSSKVDVHAGPIENRSPFMPYFTRPTPPPPHPLQVSP
ncbi:uncharacterized protein LOC110033836 [Phalaenopsis equestris]|uniref:uncharacterized protein LOC110033836 n=1 Tax=Phalaenopsis equestris TaxID=78828 RepID=UPI0009E3034B|nr:uncharacterized protein LOC110033836 [Phalaenopsis equestris]